VRREAERHARRSAFAVEFTDAPEAIDRFHRELYRPYVRSRFGPQAVIVDSGAFRILSRRSTLARLLNAGHCVAGMLLEEHGTHVRFGWFGACTDPPPRGASEVLDVACIRRAASRGFRRVLLGNARPSLADGVLRYKARFGAELVACRFPQDTLGIAIRRPSPAILQSLERASLITLRRGHPHVYGVLGGHLSLIPLA
jgi:hypothetical protein